MENGPTTNILWRMGLRAEDRFLVRDGHALYAREERDDDVRKTDFLCWRGEDGAWINMDFSPYSTPNGYAFGLWIALGYPSRAFFGMNGPPTRSDYEAVGDLMKRNSIEPTTTAHPHVVLHLRTMMMLERLRMQAGSPPQAPRPPMALTHI